MEEEIEDLVGDVKCTESQKSVATSNVYSMDFTDGSNSDKNNSSGKGTYVIDLDDSEDSDIYSVEDNNKSVVNIADKTLKNKDIDPQIESAEIYNKLKVSCASTSIPNCSIFAQEIFTQTSKTIIELARSDGVKKDLETQTSIISFSENKTVEYRIELSNKDYTNNNYSNDAQMKLKRNLTILSNTLEDESSKFRASDVETISEVSSEERFLNIIYDDPIDNILKSNKTENKHHTSNCDEIESDIEEDSLMEHKKGDPDKDIDSNSDISEVPKSVDNDIEELYTKLTESIEFSKSNRPEPDRRFSPLAPLTEESGTAKRESLMDITPDNNNLHYNDPEVTENDDVLFTNDAGIKIKILPDENNFKLPPIQQNRSCPTSPHLNFLFSLNNSGKSKSGTLPCVREIERSNDRWELGTKDLASGESPLISGRCESSHNKDKETIHLPPIHIEGYVVNSKINKTDAQISNVISINPTDNARDMISINEKIKELKMYSRKRDHNKYSLPGTVDSRSGSPSSYTDDTRLYETAERGCDSLCNELLRRLKSTSWFEIVDTLEEIPHVLDKFWDVITEHRIADLIRQVSVHIESPRTQVARSACNTIATILKNTNYTKKPDFYEAVTLLLTKTGSFSRPVRRAANVALDEIVCGVDLTQAVTALCIHGVNHKSGAVRSAAARLLVVCCAVHGVGRGGRGVLRTRPPSAAAARAYALRALSALLDDKNTEARKYAERLYSMLRPHSSFEAYYLTDVDVEVASRQMKKYDKLLLNGVTKNGR